MLTKQQARNAAVIYRGPSQLPGQSAAEIVGVVTGLDGSSHNPKTGPMAQLWIIRADVDPVSALKSGKSRAICGDCGLQDNGCYVAVKNAPLAVYRRLKRRGYRRGTCARVNAVLQARGLRLRLGAYGDPAALPASVLQQLTAGVRWTGYTHAWRGLQDPAAYQQLLMASCDSPADRALAVIRGWRTFRTRAVDQLINEGEITCPASDEAGHRTTCEQCCLCDGKHGLQDARRSIVIAVHGATQAKAVRFLRSRTEVLS